MRIPPEIPYLLYNRQILLTGELLPPPISAYKQSLLVKRRLAEMCLCIGYLACALRMATVFHIRKNI